MASNDSGNHTSKHMGEARLTRREFAALGGAAFLATLLPFGCAEPGGGNTEPNKVLAAASLVREVHEDMGHGVTRSTRVIAWKSLPPLGAATTQTVVRTSTPTASGDVIEYDITFAPGLPIAIGTHVTKHMTARYEFTHGAVHGTMREDTLAISGSVDGLPSQTATRRVMRPIRAQQGSEDMTGEEQLARGVELLNRYGHIPKQKVPGALRMVSENVSSQSPS